MLTGIELLNWARGPALQIALVVFIIGMLIRALETLLLGRKTDLAVARRSGMTDGLRTMFTRTIPPKGMWSHLIASYVWHVGLLLILILFVPHILLLTEAIGWHWPGVNNSVIDAITIIAIGAMVYTLVMRVIDPVRKLLSNFNDYFSWTITFLPLLTGYLAFHRLLLDYTLMLAIHIISVDLLLIMFPFTKLTHAVTLFFARWYNGAVAGRKGVRA